MGHLRARGWGLAHWCQARGRFYFPKMATTIFLVLLVFLEPSHPQVESESPSSILGGTL